MTHSILGYEVDGELFRSRHSLIYRAHDGEARVVLKVLREARPPPERVALFRREFDILQSLGDVEGVLRATSLGRDGDHTVMVLEDIGGASLADLVRNHAMPLEEVLHVGARASAVLAAVHRRHIIHKDVNPANIVYNRGTGQVRLIDFGISTQLSREDAHFDAGGVHEGTLPYLSPEQTGRMNRSIDYRTDLYSLGATLYHLLVGRPPFTSNDPMELIHSHIARVPPAPAEVADVPAAVSELVMRLLAKTAEDRYQSADGVAADLQECARQLRLTGAIVAFPLDRVGRPVHFSLPQKLYGREAETAHLLDAFERVAGGATELMLVSGYSGVGKSALVHEVYKPITARRGAFISGKFDQLQRDIPFASLAQAFRSLVRQVLAESEADVERWRTRLSEAVAPNGQVLLEVLPELGLLLGPQPPVPALPPAEAQTRFEHVFGRLVATCAQPTHPLVLFLDDLQWADPGSLQLLESLLLRGDAYHLFVIGAYRDNEVGPGHPLSLALDRLANGGATLHAVKVRPLALPDVTAFIADTVGASAEAVGPLAALVATKTEGNPFFLREFMRALYVEGLLGQPGQWSWDVPAIAARDITDNVVELMTARLRGLPAATADVITAAGALGADFDLGTLAIAMDFPVQSVWERLWPAVKEGMVLTRDNAWKAIGGAGDYVPLDVGCRFAHDRVQQAAYALTPVTERATLHWNAGRRMRTAWPARQERLFDVVRHLNAGRGLATPPEREELAALNLAAARLCKASAAFAAAKEHARVGLGLLGPDRFERFYDLSMALLALGVETAYQTGDFGQMDRWFAEGVQHAREVLDTAWMQEIKTEAYNAQGRPLEALTHALDYLDKLGVSCPRQPGMEDVGAEMGRAAALLQGRSLDDLATMGEIADPAIRTAVALICKIYSSAYVASPLIFIVITLKQVQLVARHGNCAVSPLAFAVYGLLQAGLAGDVKSAYEFGKLSDRLLDRPDVGRYKAQALHLFSCHTRFWREHVRRSADGERQAYRVGLETGEMEFGSYGGHVASKYAFFHGQDLATLRPEVEQYTVALKRYRNDLARSSHAPWHQAIANLSLPCAEPWRLAGPVYDAVAARPALEAANDRMAISNTYLAELILAYLFERFDDAVALADQGAAFLDAVLSQFNQPLHVFYDALSRLAVCASRPEAERAALLAKVEEDLTQLRKWAEAGPENFAQKVALVEAERFRVLGQDREARERYDDAIQLAQTHEFTHDEALAFEAAGRFFLARGKAVAARHYFRDAYDVYVRWGATTKANALDEAHPAMLSTTALPATSGTVTTTTRWGTTRRGALDLASVLKASQAISTEVVLSSLLRRLAATVLESSGAERAVLLLLKDGQLLIEAEAHAGRAEVEVLASRPVARDGEPCVAESVVNFVVRSGETVVLDDALTAPETATDAFVAKHRTRSLLCHPITGQGRLGGLVYLENNLAPGVFTPERKELVDLLAGQMAISIDNARLYATLEERVKERTAQLEARNGFIRRVFGRYMSDDVVSTLLESEQALALGGERRTVTVMFTDLRGFTATCEVLRPESVLRMLNTYFRAMTRVIEARHGTIDNIIGDGMVVLFGAPLWREDDPCRAVACALEMQLAMAEVNEENRLAGLPALSLGVGIHTGDVVVGNVGSERRARYSVIGRNVNLASRVEAIAASGHVLVTDATRAAVRVPLRIDGTHSFTPKGVSEPVVVHEIGGIDGDYGVALPRSDGAQRPLASPIDVQVAVVEGKAVGDRRFAGRIVAAGDGVITLSLGEPMAPGTSLRLELCLIDGTAETVYARTAGTDGDGACEARLASASEALRGLV